MLVDSIFLVAAQCIAPLHKYFTQKKAQTWEVLRFTLGVFVVFDYSYKYLLILFLGVFSNS